MVPSPSRSTYFFLSGKIAGIGIAGTLFGPATTVASWWIIPLGLSLLFLWKGRLVHLALVLAAGGLFGLWYTQWWRSRYLPPIDHVRHIEFEARIVAYPTPREAAMWLIVEPVGWPRTRILVKAPRYPPWQYGQRILVKGRTEAPEAFEEFNYPRYLERIGVHTIVHRPKSVTLVGQEKPNPLLYHLFKFRLFYEETINRLLPEPEAGLLAGILLGSRQSISEPLQEALRSTGTAHIVAISGANITLLMSLMIRLLPLYSLRKQMAATFALSLALACMTGATAGVLRGSVQSALSSYVRMAGRKVWPIPTIILSASLLLLINPLLLVADPGFQLSFAAFSGLLLWGSFCKTLFDKVPFIARLPEVLRATNAETFASSVGTLPISYFYFHHVSGWGLIVNPFILWLLPSLSIIALLLLLFAALSPITPFILIFPVWILLHAILGIITFFGGLAGPAP